VSSQRTPNFDDLVGQDVPASERDRLRRTHELLLQAGPPPELSPELDPVPWPDEALQPLGLFRSSNRRQGRPWMQMALAAAAVLVVGFLLGQALSSKSGSFSAIRVVEMKGTPQAPHAAASIAVGRKESDGNWPMLVTVTNLPPAPDGGYYDLWLSNKGKPVALCGTFNTRFNGDTAVKMSAAYSLDHLKFDGWVVTKHVAGLPEGNAPIVLSTA
jgi:hypothetical protein